MSKVVGTILIILLVIILVEGKRELKFFKITRYSLKVPKFRLLDTDKKIVLLADLHNKVYGEHNDKLFRAIRKEKPDLILIAGDMLVGREKSDFQEALSFIAKLPPLCPVYYSLGNHEQRLKEASWEHGGETYYDYKNALQESGIHFLENQTEDVMLDKLCVRISGLELPMDTYEKFKKQRVTPEDISRCIQHAEKDKFNILLAHNPVFFPAYKEWGADLTLSGHLHGGIIRIPGLGGLITPQAVLFPAYSGEMTLEGEQALIVSRGLGTHTINLRFCNNAEVVVINMQPFDEE
ncbi:metallophosphoesterase [Clostridium sp. C105KSO13]|uniref:metallophosphoesterase n=1 Tax=Clostridium sp. C105KSO13 TaxID=1776045 RepID=UPI00074079BC|nr:metallophosphoesterase [Clostridium sp. C105KSO13]CUX43627.1 putative metallophosphoesterase [Clostridium sp. C105KSO13]